MEAGWVGCGEQEAEAQVPPLPPPHFTPRVHPQPRIWSHLVEIISPPASSYWGVVPRWRGPSVNECVCMSVCISVSVCVCVCGRRRETWFCLAQVVQGPSSA